MVNQDRNIFAAAMLALGEADAMITGTTRPFSQSLSQVRWVIDDEDGATPFGINVIVGRSQTVLIADTAVTERPTAEQFAAIAIRSAAFARRMGQEPRVAFISYTTFGNPPGRHIEELREAVKLLDTLQTDFEYEGEMGPDVALNHDMQGKFYPFSRLTGPANILVMPGLQSANISAKLLRALGGESVLGPYLHGHGAAGADRADDRQRVGPGDAGSAGRGRRRRDPQAPTRRQSLDPLGLADPVGGAQRGDQAVEVGEVVDFDVDVEGVEAAVAVGERQIDDVGALGAQGCRPFRPARRRHRAG